MIRVLFDNTEINGNYISRIEQHVNPYNKNFVIGNTVCREFNIDIHNAGFSSIPNVVYLYEDNGSNTQSNWTKYATLLVDSSELQDGDYTTFNLTDVMVRFNQDLTYTQNDTVKTILTSICTAKGISLATQSFYMDDFAITWTDELTERDFISYVAEVNGGFAYINASGNLVIEEYSSTPAGSVDINQVAYFKIGERHYIDRVYVELASATKYYPSTNTYDTLYLNPENILYNDAQGYTIDGIIQHIYSVVNGLEFYNIEIQNCPTLPNVHACQIVRLGETGSWTPFICTVDWSYNTAWRGGYKIELECKIQEETQIVSTPELVRRINIKVDREAGEIRQEVSDLDDSVTASLALKVDKDGDEIISLINASADNIIFNTKSLIFGEYPNGQYIEVKNFASGNTNVGVTFDGTGYVRFQPQEKFTVNNLTNNGDLLNEFVMNKSGTQSQPYVVLKNYDHLQNYTLANSFEMDASLNDTTDGRYNYLKILNRQTASGTAKDANYLSFSAYSSKNVFYLSNRKTGGTVVANQVDGASTSSSDYLYISNYFVSKNVVANRMYLSTSSSGNTVSLYNNRTNASSYTDYGNHLWFYATDTQTTMAMRNYKSDHNSYANEIFMLGRPLNGSENSLDIRNYDVDGSNIANDIHMVKSSTTNSFYLRLYRGGTTVANIFLYRDTSQGLTVGLRIPTNSTYGYTYCNFELKQDGNIYASGNHFYWNGSQKW